MFPKDGLIQLYGYKSTVREPLLQEQAVLLPQANMCDSSVLQREARCCQSANDRHLASFGEFD